jgi:hypothetical protein
MNKTAANGGLDREPDLAIIDAKDIEARWKKYSDEQMKRLGMIDPVTGGLPKKSDGSIDWDKASGSTFYGQMAEDVQKKLDSQMRTNNTALKSLSKSFGRNPIERGKYITEHPDTIKQLRQTLAEQKIDISDYSKVTDALYDMGLISANSTGYCERWTEIINSIVEGTPRIYAPSAQMSEKGWQERGFYATASKKINTKAEGDTFVWNEIKSGNVSEGDKILIYYADKPGEKAYGHIVTVLYDEEAHEKRRGGWGFVSDFVQATPTGLTDQPVTEIKILRKLDKTLSDGDRALIDYGSGLK